MSGDPSATRDEPFAPEPANLTRECWRDCLDCHRICLETVAYLQTSGRAVPPSTIRLLFNCAELCQTTAKFLRGGWELIPRTCALCAEACARCAEHCDAFADDAQMAACAKACRRAVDACWRLAASLAA